MKIFVSACLAGENCKYNGGNNRDENVLALMKENEVIRICPEVMGGLPTPRVPAEIREGTVMTRDGRNVDASFREGARLCLEMARRERPDLIVLKSRSPSCAVRQHYDGSFCGRLVEGPGVSAELLLREGFRVIEAEDLPDLRETGKLPDEEDGPA